MEWRWKRYGDLSLDELYELLRARELVFEKYLEVGVPHVKMTARLAK